MATVPVTRTWVAGEVVLASHFNDNIRDVLNFLLAPPIFEGRQLVAQSVPNFPSASTITMTAEDVDSAGGHSTSTNTSRYTAVYPGWYKHSGAVSWEGNTTGRRWTWWRKNGADVAGSQIALAATSAGDIGIPARSRKIYLNVGEYTELTAMQDSGAPRNTYVGSSPGQSGVSIEFESN